MDVLWAPQTPSSRPVPNPLGSSIGTIAPFLFAPSDWGSSADWFQRKLTHSVGESGLTGIIAAVGRIFGRVGGLSPFTLRRWGNRGPAAHLGPGQTGRSMLMSDVVDRVIFDLHAHQHQFMLARYCLQLVKRVRGDHPETMGSSAVRRSLCHIRDTDVQCAAFVIFADGF